MLILLLIVWIVVIPALVVSLTCYGAIRRHSGAARSLGQPEPARLRARLRSRLAAFSRSSAPHLTH